MDRSCSRSNRRDAGVVAGLFPPQERTWALPADVPLTPKAARRLAREAAVQTYEPAAKALNEDWGTSLAGRQVDRWAVALGRGVVTKRDREVLDYQQGRRPECP